MQLVSHLCVLLRKRISEKGGDAGEKIGLRLLTISRVRIGNRMFDENLFEKIDRFKCHEIKGVNPNSIGYLKYSEDSAGNFLFDRNEQGWNG